MASLATVEQLNIDLADDLVNIVESDPSRAWHLAEIVDEATAPIVDVAICMATLVNTGRVRRLLPGRYAAI